MTKTAYCIHHTHWDLIWYFTAQDATVQLCYNVKEMLDGFATGRIDQFFFDGQTAPIEEYLHLHPEDATIISTYIKQKKLVIGPFHSQLDCFICSGESVLNNLRLGYNTAKKLGHASKVAYLPDSFGHSYDFPKIFHQYGIKDFVITRGVGDDYQLGSEFYMRSNDGNEILVCTMIAGYGYGCYAFKNGTLFKNDAKDYNKLQVSDLIQRLLDYSTLENAFVFPLGFDQNPAMLDIQEKIDAYHQEQDDIKFVPVTWQDFCNLVRKEGKQLKTHEHELFSTQYHRVHRSIFSARADIKAMQDTCERTLTYALQPLMTMFDALGISYDHGLLDQAWDNLLRCQTHSSATLTDETNRYIEQVTRNTLLQIEAHQMYLLKLLSISMKDASQDGYPFIFCNTLPRQRNLTIKTKIQSKSRYFKIMKEDYEIPYTLLSSIKKNGGVLRKDIAKLDNDEFFYESEIIIHIENVPGFSYQTFTIKDCEKPVAHDIMSKDAYFIENGRFKIYKEADGIHIVDKVLKKVHKKAIYIEESGDEGDSFDYSYPDYDWILYDYLEDAHINCLTSQYSSTMSITGKMNVPYDLDARKHKITNTILSYEINLELTDDNLIRITGYIENTAIDHRVRLIVTGDKPHTYSLAGTQYSTIKRESEPAELKTWRADGWFEEPSATWPLLNHVSIEDDEITTVMTKSCKEYEVIHEGKKDIAITLFRSYGAMGYPDLNRRPGRPSGLDYMVFKTPECQMLKKNYFSLALTWYDTFNANRISQDMVDYTCPTVCYEHQNFDKSIYPISYFPTNPLNEQLPRKWQLFAIEGLAGCFGSLVKDDTDDSYLLRLYNCDTKPITSGTMQNITKDTVLSITDLTNERNELVNPQLPMLKPGELRIIRIQRQKK